jgi:hypothetical protein
VSVRSTALLAGLDFRGAQLTGAWVLFGASRVACHGAGCSSARSRRRTRRARRGSTLGEVLDGVDDPLSSEGSISFDYFLETEIDLVFSAGGGGDR